MASRKRDIRNRRNSEDKDKPIVVSNEVEIIKKTKDMIKLFNNLKLSKYHDARDAKPKIRKGLRRSIKVKALQEVSASCGEQGEQLQ